MRAAFGFLVIVIVLAIGLSLGKKQVQSVRAPEPAASVPAPQAVQQQVQGALETAAAQRASEAAP